MTDTEKTLPDQVIDSLAEERREVFASGDLEKIEEAYLTLQRRDIHLRLMTEMIQARAISYVRQKSDSLSELSLFQGTVLRMVELGLDKLGATADEVSDLLFGMSVEDSKVSTDAQYAIMCMEFADQAAKIESSIEDMQAEKVEKTVLDMLSVSGVNPREPTDKKDLN